MKTRIIVALLVCYAGAGTQARAQNSNNSPADKDGSVRVALGRSINARLHPAPVSAVKLPEGFWAVRNRVLVERTLPALRLQLEEHGAIDNFLRVSGKKNVPRKGRGSSDADLYRWIEAAAWAIASPDVYPATKQKLQADIDALIPVIAGAQDQSGYINTNYSGDRAHLRFGDLVHSHEDLCLSRLISAAIAYFRVTQNRSLLTVATRAADHVVSTFGPDMKPFVAAHPELAGSLIELYRTVGDTKYLDFARYILGGNERERLKLRDFDVVYMSSGKPFSLRTELEGHAVNALEAASAATDYFAESGEPAYRRAIDSVWNDLTQHHLLVTGGVGLRPGSEVVDEPFDLLLGSFVPQVPISVANGEWNLRLLAVSADAKYADLLERIIYNGAAAGLSSSGGLACGKTGSGDKARNVYYENETCPPDFASLSLSIGSAFYATGADGLFVSLYGSSELNWHLEDGTALRVVQTTNYPYDGDVKLTLYPAKPASFILHLRWPAWAQTIDVAVNGEKTLPPDAALGSFVNLSRTWQPGDTVTISMPMPPNVIKANIRAAELWAKASIERGPLVFSLQQADQVGVPVSECLMRSNAPGIVETHKELFGSPVFLRFPGFVTERPASGQPLYSLWKDTQPTGRRPITLVFAPYWLLGSREVDGAVTWVPVSRVSEAVSPAIIPVHTGGIR